MVRVNVIRIGPFIEPTRGRIHRFIRLITSLTGRFSGFKAEPDRLVSGITGLLLEPFGPGLKTLVRVALFASY